MTPGESGEDEDWNERDKDGVKCMWEMEKMKHAVASKTIWMLTNVYILQKCLHNNTIVYIKVAFTLKIIHSTLNGIPYFYIVLMPLLGFSLLSFIFLIKNVQ